MKKPSKEWNIGVPWGKLTLISWGDPTGEKVLLVHGRQDSAATFIPILEYLPENYHYVAFDSPGHGKSDPFPTGVMLTRFHFIASVDFAVKHLGWTQFIYMAHSFGCDQGLFYNAIYPNKIKKFIFFDPLVSLQRLQIHDVTEYYSTFYAEYYSNYWEYNNDNRVWSKRKAVESVMRARGLSEGLAEVVLSRNLQKVGDDQYKLSWDRRLKLLAPQNYPVNYYCQLFSNIPPTLIIAATESGGYLKGKTDVEHIVKTLRTTGNITIDTVEGNHDVHLVKAGLVAKKVIPFLEQTYSCKL